MYKPLQRRMVLPFVILLSFAAPTWANSKAQAEAQLAQKIKQSLEAVMGPGRVKVSVEGRMTQAAQTRQRTRSNPQLAAERQQRRVQNAQGQQSESTQSQRAWTYNQRERLESSAARLVEPQITVIYQPPDLSEGESPISEAELRRWVASASGAADSQIYLRAVRFARPQLPSFDDDEGLSWLWVLVAGLSGLALGLVAMAVFFRRRRRLQAQNLNTGAYDYGGQWSVQTPPPSSSGLTGQAPALPRPAIPVQPVQESGPENSS